MKVYHLIAKELGDGIEITVSPDGEDKFGPFEVLGILVVVQAQITSSLGNPQPAIPLIIPKASIN